MIAGATRLLALTVLTGFALPAGSTPVENLFVDPDAARNFDYCGLVYTNPDQPLSSRDLGEYRDANADETTLAAKVLVDAGIAVATASRNERDCRRAFKRGRATFDKRLGSELRKLENRQARSLSEDPQIAEIQQAISEHRILDQAARQTYVALQTSAKSGAEYWARQLSASHATVIDAQSTGLMRQVLDTHTWIDAKRFGAAVSNHAWLLVQHADDHPEFQALALERMEPFLASGAIEPSNYAYLYDRVAVNSGREQRYGTQPDWTCKDGRLELKPLENPEGVNQRRAAMGMGSVEDGLAAMAQSVCR